jgi:hypothetical protein
MLKVIQSNKKSFCLLDTEIKNYIDTCDQNKKLYSRQNIFKYTKFITIFLYL